MRRQPMDKRARAQHEAVIATTHHGHQRLRWCAGVVTATAAAWLLASWLAASATAGITNAATENSVRSPAKTTKLAVSAGSPSEFRFKLSKLRVPTGVVTFVVTNKGHLPHDFKIAGKKTKLLQPGKHQTLEVTFKKKGGYRFLCTVSGHAAAGMKGTLRVK
jgi:uncharacterized cupredoxin-like copper-binding protein